jgi:hypothetical protein
VDEDEKKPTVYRLASPNRVKWDLFVMILAIWNCFSIPFVIAFKPVDAESPGMLAFDTMIDFLFIIDIIIQFKTSYIHSQTGVEIMDLNLIAKNYIRGGRFFLDLLASIPFDTIAGGAGSEDTNLNVFGLLKLIRILRLGKIILYMRAKENVKGSMKLL